MSASDWTNELQDKVVRAGMSARFHSYDPEQLWAMVSAADGATPKELGDLLTAAAKTIREIGGDLREHSMSVEWEGEAGDAFREWCHKAAMTTLRLGEYSESAGKWMGHAADTLYEVKPQIEALRQQSAASQAVLNAHSASNVDVGNHGGGPSDAEVKSAKSQYAKDHADAAGLMAKLAQSYSGSTEQIERLEAPQFPELPERFVPPAQKRITQDEITRGGGAVNGPSPSAAAPQGVAPPAGASGAPYPGEVVSPDPTPSAPGRPIGTEIDSVEAPPKPPATPAAPAPGPPPAGRPDGPMPPPITAAPPVPGRPATPPQGVPGSRPPTGSRGPLAPPAQGTPGRGIPGRPGGSGIIGGRPVPPTSSPTGPIPRGTVIGETPRPGQAPLGRGPIPGTPGGTGQTPSPRPGGPASNGVTGTPRPTTTGGTTGTPRPATPPYRGVIGASQPPETRGTHSGTRTGPPATGGVTGTPRQAGADRTPGFTSGGTGLARGSTPSSGPARPPGQAAQEGATSPPGGQRNSPPCEGSSSSRPGRATEPEETWQLGQRRAIPPVIE